MPLSLVAVGVAVLAFFRMNAGGQFDDAEGPAWSVLMDDDRPPEDAPEVAPETAPGTAGEVSPALEPGATRDEADGSQVP